jgi:hypothetical protein
MSESHKAIAWEDGLKKLEDKFSSFFNSTEGIRKTDKCRSIADYIIMSPDHKSIGFRKDCELPPYISMEVLILFRQVYNFRI